MIGLFRKTRKILVAGHAPDGFALGVDGEQSAFVLVLDEVVPDPPGIVARLVGRADQHDVARVQHRMDTLDDVAGIRGGRPFFGLTGRVAYVSFHGALPLPCCFLWRPRSAIAAGHDFYLFY